MSTPQLVHTFYERIWNAGDLEVIPSLLSAEFAFRGSLCNQIHGHEALKEYVRSVRGSLSEYHCEILDCVSEADRAFARMRFSGVHTGTFRGYAPTGQRVGWFGAALFRFAEGVIAELWVLGDLTSLDRTLQQNAAAASGNQR